MTVTDEKLYWYKAKVVKIVDGDTIDLDFDLGMGVHKHERVRLMGVDTPEIHGVKKGTEEHLAGVKAKARVLLWLGAKDLLVETIKDRKGKYGRYLARVYFPDADSNYVCLNDKLLTEGLAKPYDK